MMIDNSESEMETTKALQTQGGTSTSQQQVVDDERQDKKANKLFSLRQAYDSLPLSEDSWNMDPFELFELWLNEAKASPCIEPNAMCLSTCGKSGRPSSRYVLLKYYDNRGYCWFTNFNSRKGRDVAENPFASIVFWWEGLMKSVRIEGRVEKTEPELSDTYFHCRPKNSRLGAWASDQSAEIGSRDLLDRKYMDFEKEYEGEDADIPRPEFWGGYRLVPDRFEFWKGRESRMHDRLVFEKKEGEEKWISSRLQP